MLVYTCVVYVAPFLFAFASPQRRNVRDEVHVSLHRRDEVRLMRQAHVEETNALALARIARPDGPLGELRCLLGELTRLLGRGRWRFGTRCSREKHSAAVVYGLGVDRTPTWTKAC
jgi:hypothetical protein